MGKEGRKEGRQTLREKKTKEGKKSEKEERKKRGSMAGVEMRETERDSGQIRKWDEAV